MNNSAKNAILGRLREERNINLLNNNSEKGHKIWPEWELEQKIRIFKEQLELDKAEIHETNIKEYPELLKQILKSKKISSLIYGSNKNYCSVIEDLKESLANLKIYLPDSIENGFKDLLFQADASITEAKAGIAETGTLVLWPDKDEPRLISLVPPIHIVLIDKNKIYNSFKEIVIKEKWKDSLPTNALLISGPSKTADIEFNLAYGIHGPCELIVLIIAP